MRNHRNRKPGSLLTLAGAAVVAVAGTAVADDSTKEGPGTGYAVEFTSDRTAEGSLTSAAPNQEPMPVRPGFGYTIHFMTGAAAEALLPVPKP